MCGPASPERRVIDRLLNVDTAERVDLAELGLDAPDRVDYGAGGWGDFGSSARPRSSPARCSSISGRARAGWCSPRLASRSAGSSASSSSTADGDRAAQRRDLPPAPAGRRYRAGDRRRPRLSHPRRGVRRLHVQPVPGRDLRVRDRAHATSLGPQPGREWREATAVQLYVLEPRGSPRGAQT